jgi:L-iditol 2-dehydrogenase
MKAAFFYKAKDIRIEETADPTPAAGELLLEVTAVGVCGSDLHTYLHGNIGGVVAEQPLILGHEAAGRVIGLGAGTDGKFSVGQAVAIDPAIPCWECEQCEAGHANLCLNLKFIGLYPSHGALREVMVHPARACVPLPDGIDTVAGALLEPLGVALHAINLSKIRVGDDVFIIGCGAIGLLLIRLAKLAGAKRIFASDNHDWRLNMAREFGSDVLIRADQTDSVAAVIAQTQGRGVDVAIESAWADKTVNECAEAVRYGGRVIVVGIPVEDFLTLKASTSRRKGLTVKLSRRMKHTYPAAIALATSKDVMLDKLATHRFSLDDTQQAFETAATYADGVIRAMVLPRK